MEYRINDNNTPEFNIVLNIFKFHIEDYLCIANNSEYVANAETKRRLKEKAKAFLYSDNAKAWANEINMDLDFVLRNVEKRNKH